MLLPGRLVDNLLSLICNVFNRGSTIQWFLLCLKCAQAFFNLITEYLVEVRWSGPGSQDSVPSLIYTTLSLNFFTHFPFSAFSHFSFSLLFFSRMHALKGRRVVLQRPSFQQIFPARRAVFQSFPARFFRGARFSTDAAHNEGQVFNLLLLFHHVL